jgi:hypothetical protein
VRKSVVTNYSSPPSVEPFIVMENPVFIPNLSFIVTYCKFLTEYYDSSLSNYFFALIIGKLSGKHSDLPMHIGGYYSLSSYAIKV